MPSCIRYVLVLPPDTMEKMLRRLELDLYYLKHRSLWFDVKILGLTFLSIISGKKF